MSVAGVNVSNAAYAVTYDNTAKADSSKQTESKDEKASSQGAVYEKTSSSNKTSYSVNKMSSEKRAELVKQLQQDQENRQKQLMNIVNKMISGQAEKFSQANDDFWKFLAKGDYTVDAETKKQAQADIAEDGYYGVNQTAQRIFDFASALAGDDVEKMKKMQAAFEKGYSQAEKAWGGNLPGISGQTKDAVNQMFEDYYSSKNVITE